MLGTLLKLISSRVRVRTQAVPRMVEYLKADLLEKGFARVDLIPDSVGLVIVQEALRRAAEKEKDQCPRYGEFYRQVEATADSILSIFNGEENADPRIKGILVFYRLI